MFSSLLTLLKPKFYQTPGWGFITPIAVAFVGCIPYLPTIHTTGDLVVEKIRTVSLWPPVTLSNALCIFFMFFGVDNIFLQIIKACRYRSGQFIGWSGFRVEDRGGYHVGGKVKGFCVPVQARCRKVELNQQKVSEPPEVRSSPRFRVSS